MKSVNVLTGPNGCGKSNLYHSVFLLAKAASGGLAHALAAEGGMSSVLWAGARRTGSANPSRKDPVRMRLSVDLDAFSYELACGLPKPMGSAFDRDPEIKEEFVWARGPRRPSTTFFERNASGAWIRGAAAERIGYSGELPPGESVLAELREPHLYPELSAIREEVSRWRFYHHFRTDAAAPMRHPQPGVRTAVLSHDGSDLAAAIQTIREIGFSEDLDAAVARAFSGARVDVIQTEAGFSLRLEVPGLHRPLEAREFSDGTVRFLCLLAALLSPRPPTLLALNEPETSLHPDLLSPLAGLIASAARGSQLWITTHSRELAARIAEATGQPAVELELNGGATVVRGATLIDPEDGGQ